MRIFKKFTIFLIAGILLFGFFLRQHDYKTLPRHGATFDEFAWTWQGINLWQTGIPMSWSPHPQYAHREHLIYQGAAFWIVKPYLEHPPAFGLVAGGFALLNGAKDMYTVTLEIIRPLALILGVLSILMVFWLMLILYDKYTALLAALLYASIPTVVIGSRLVQNENFLIPFWLLSLIFMVHYLRSKKKKWLIAAAVIAGVLCLAKIPWIVVGGSLVVLLLFHDKWKEAGSVVGIVSAFLAMFFLYGIYFDGELFFNLWKLQLARYDISFIGLYSILTKPLLIDRYYLDGWIYMGIFSLLVLAQNYKKHAFILFPFISYLAIYMFAIPDEPGHGWYRYPFIPFLVMSLALFIRENFGKNPFLTFIFLSFVGTALFQLTWFETFGFSYFVYRAAIISWLLVFLPILFSYRKLEALLKYWSYCWLFVFITFNIWTVFIFIE